MLSFSKAASFAFPTVLATSIGVLLLGCAAPLGPTGSGRSNTPITAGQVAQHSAAQQRSMAPDGFDYPHVFDGYWPDSVASWARNWTRQFDLTGVAWDDRKAGVLISPRHVLFANHFARSIGDALVFHDRSGRPVARRLVAAINLANIPFPDLQVGVLDEDVTVSHYRVLPPRTDWSSLLPGAGVFVTDQEKKLLTARVKTLQPGSISFTHEGMTNRHLVEQLIVGDSGHPTFLPINGELVLIETHTGGGQGSGPFVSDPIVFAAINRAMIELGGGYQLETVPVQ